MYITLSLALIAAIVAMVTLARPHDGEPAPFLKVWIVGQLYVLTALVSTIMGVALLITN